MKKLLTLLFIIFICFFLCGCNKKTEQTTLDKIKEKDFVTVGVKFDSKPFGFIEDGEIKGLDIDIAKQIAKNILDNENKVKFIEVTSENRISKLMSEEVDMLIATMTDTQQRREIIDFSVPYYFSGQAMMCRKTDNSKSDVETQVKKVVVHGTTAEKTLKNSYSNSEVETVSTYNMAFDILKNEPNSCLIADEEILLSFINNNDNFVIHNKKFTTEPYAVAIRKDNENLKKYINHTIKYMETTGELKKLIDKWIP